MSAATMSRPFACPAAHAARAGRGTVMVAQERRRSQADIRYGLQRDHREQRGAGSRLFLDAATAPVVVEAGFRTVLRQWHAIGDALRRWRVRYVALRVRRAFDAIGLARRRASRPHERKAREDAKRR